MLRLPCLLLLLTFSGVSYAQDTAFIRQEIATLSAKGMAGRGYVSRGGEKAARYLTDKFKSLGLQPLSKDYGQSFTFSVNTFPGRMVLRIGDRQLKAGEDYLIDPYSSRLVAENKKIRIHDFSGLTPTDTTKQWMKIHKQLSKKNRIHLLLHTDTLMSVMGWGNRLSELSARLPEGGFLIPKEGKPIWTVAGNNHRATVFWLYDSKAWQQKRPKATIYADQQLDTQYQARNIIGMVPGTAVPDSFIVLTAHYDHLGKMGAGTTFPGASDNASGTAMLLSLARTYVQFPQRYTMVFIAFAGEEAGLLGSRYFTDHPLIELNKIRFLVNLDIMGDATEGITVINGTERKDEMTRLLSLNAALGTAAGITPEATYQETPTLALSPDTAETPLAPGSIWNDTTSAATGETDAAWEADGYEEAYPESTDYTVMEVQEQTPLPISQSRAWQALPAVLPREPAANSDHYYFYLKGVPCFFIFTNGGPGHYHDIWDKSNTLSLNNIVHVQALIERFLWSLQNGQE